MQSANIKLIIMPRINNAVHHSVCFLVPFGIEIQLFPVATFCILTLSSSTNFVCL